MYGPMHDTEDKTTMPRAKTGDTPEWERGDMVRWQVEPDLFGKIVHVDDEKHVAMVEIMAMEGGEMSSSGFTITAGFSDITMMKMPESKSDMTKHGYGDDEMSMYAKDNDADMAKSEDDVYGSKSDAEDRADEIGCEGTHSMEIDGETMYMPCDTHDTYEDMIDSMSTAIPAGIASEALAEIGEMDVNGLVMWDDKMGAISGFTMEDGELMIEIDVVERSDGEFQKTGETITESMTSMESMGSTVSGDVAQLEASMHTPNWSGLDDNRDWSRPAMEDFDTDDMSEIDNHFMVSKTGEWPPENYSDLALPVVWPNGDLSLDALDSVIQTAASTDGVSEDMAETIKTKANNLAKDKFDTEVMGEENAGLGIKAATMDDDIRNGRTGSSTMDIAALEEDATNTNTNMTDINYANATEGDIEEMSEPVVMEQEDVEDLRDKAAEADELSEKLDALNSSLDELADNKELLEEVDEERLGELREYDEAVVLTDNEHDELQGLVDEIGEIFADELADYSPFGSEELQDRFTPIELRDKVEDHAEASVGAELGASESDPEPEGGSASTEELEQSDEDAQVEATEDELREQVAEELEDGKLYRQAEKVREGEISLEAMGIDPSEALAD